MSILTANVSSLYEVRFFNRYVNTYVQRGLNITRFVAVPIRNTSHFHSSRTIQNNLYLTAT